jgi:HEAT repeat protein
VAASALQAAAFGNATAGVKLTAAAALLAHGDISVLSIAEGTLMEPQATIDGEVRQNLLSAIYEGVNNKKAIPILTRLLDSSDVQVRRVAAMALRNTKSEEAIDDLTLALSDNDFEVRYYGVIGLAEITGQNDWQHGSHCCRYSRGSASSEFHPRGNSGYFRHAERGPLTAHKLFPSESCLRTYTGSSSM